MNDGKTNLIGRLYKDRQETFVNWETAYNQTKSEIESLINSFEAIKTIPNPVFQDLTIKFYTIHLCNFFVFHVRKILIDRNKGTKTQNILRSNFANPSSTPSPSVMNNLLDYLVEDADLLQRLSEYYKKIQTIRNKYAHGASAETSLNITMDEFKEIFIKIQTLR